MPWLIKNDDVMQYEPNYNDNIKRKQNTTATSTTSTPVSSIQQQQQQSEQQQQQSLFFVHVPRCGGTSLMHYYELPKKIYTSYKYNYWKQLGMYTFFSRYKTLEANNFPFFTSGNAFAVAITIVGIYFISDVRNDYVPSYVGIILVLFGITLFILLTIIFTAPVIGRFPMVHHGYLIFVHYILCQFMECTSYITGTNKTGYMMHLTATKLLYTYQYVSEPQWDIACSMAIVRNPYSRMISIYTYNRFGEWESFTHFMNDWYHNVTKYYRLYNNCDEWYTPCHAIPQFEYTHHTIVNDDDDVDNDNHHDNQGIAVVNRSTTATTRKNPKRIQLVKSIIKQEELKYLKDVYQKTTTTTTAKAVATSSSTPNSNNNDTNNENNIINKNNNNELVMDTTATGEDTAEISSSPPRNNNNNRKDIKDVLTIEDPNNNNNNNNNTNTTNKTLSIHNLPNTVRDALINMPHTNQRTIKKKWYDYYTQETLNLVYEIYYNDFIYFDYNPILQQRPDLDPPILYTTQCKNNNNAITGNDIEQGN